jgi:hypothetical protein
MSRYLSSADPPAENDPTAAASSVDAGATRFWDRYLRVLDQNGVKPKAARWYVARSGKGVRSLLYTTCKAANCGDGVSFLLYTTCSCILPLMARPLCSWGVRVPTALATVDRSTAGSEQPA